MGQDIPSVIMANVQSLANKMEELEILARTQRVYRECRVMCFTETWLHNQIPCNNGSIAGFRTIRLIEINEQAVGREQRGGGIALLVNNK